MKITLNWLRQYVAVEESPEQLADRLTLLGLEVEAIETIGGEFDNIVVGQVLTREKHPNADKLSYCRVADGSGERLVVCGAQNFQAGDKVALALPGAVMPTAEGEKPFVIQVGKIRGLESQGMMCSNRELGLGQDHDGILILPSDAPVGQSLATFLGRAERDVLFDLEVTPNRPDLNSLVGIAREVAASSGLPLKLPPDTLPEPDPKVSATGGIQEWVSLSVEAPDLCPRYTARLIRGVRIGPSPDWLRSALEKVGLRSINNVVDITNYVLLELGHPLHAFDYRTLNPLSETGPDVKPTLRIRRAQPGESFQTLDGVTRILNPEMLVIADGQRAVAVAGVMGGAETEIQEHTVDVLLESAYFQPASIRRTSKQLGLRTEASYRYERGADVGICDRASRRAAALILEWAGGELVEGVLDSCSVSLEPRRVALRPERVNAVLGTQLTVSEIVFYLKSLGFSNGLPKPRPVDAVDDEAVDLSTPIDWWIPTYRVDLKQEIDLVEEVARMHGVNNIPSTPPRGAVGTHAFDAVHDDMGYVRTLLTGLGLDEAQTQTLISEQSARWMAASDPADAGRSWIALANPMSSDMTVLRPSLLPGLVTALQHNAHHKNPDGALFELGRVFRREGDGIVERWHVALAMTGRRAPGFWMGDTSEAPVDLFDLKGVLEELFERWGIGGMQYLSNPFEPTRETFYVQSARVALGGRLELGSLGQLSPRLARSLDIRGPVFLAEIDLETLRSRRQPTRSMKPLAQFPAVRRDVALLVSQDTSHDAVLKVIQKQRIPILDRVELFDLYCGDKIPQGRKSLGYTLVYRAPDRTLKDEEVQKVHTTVTQAVCKALGAEIR